MKDLQEAIEETLKPIFSYEIDICKKCGHNKESHYWNGGGFVEASGYDSCLVEGCGCTCLSEETETEVSVEQTPLNHYVEELTQLITSREQVIREEAAKEAIRDYQMNGYVYELPDMENSEDITILRQVFDNKRGGRRIYIQEVPLDQVTESASEYLAQQEENK